MRFATVFGLAVVVSISGTFLLTGDAAAQTCQSGCGLQKKACVQSARTVKLACKLDCRTNSAPVDLGACMDGCVDKFRSSKDSCHAALSGCLGTCEAPPDGSGECVDGCGQDLAACAQGVVTEARTCVKDCKAVPDHLSCLAACGATAEAGAEICAANFSSCEGDCGSPSGAFVD